jgi:fumarate hydratase, class II
MSDAKPRTATDSFGSIEIPASALWGAQTARSLSFFAIGEQRMPQALIYALAWIKCHAASVNSSLGLLDADQAGAIAQAATRVANGEFDAQFPLSVWQTGSGTQTNMNVNEVIAQLASDSLQQAVHANDHVNLGQSSNDVFPTAMHVAVSLAIRAQLQPGFVKLRAAMAAKALQFADVVKLGRTHLQDATPITFGQEWSGYLAELDHAANALHQSLPGLYALAIGGTAVGTGLNTHAQFGAKVSALLAAQFALPFVQASNLFAAMAGHQALLAVHGALKALAVALIKIGSDIRLMASGPRGGLGELILPANEPGSSIMPGKINPTQIEAMLMVCAQVLGHDTAISFAASQGQFELNVYKPLIALNVLDSVRLLADVMDSFAVHCVAGIEVNQARVDALLQQSLMLVTALVPHIGYARAASIAKHAHQHGLSLRDAATQLGEVGAEDFDRWVNVAQMLGPLS